MTIFGTIISTEQIKINSLSTGEYADVTLKRNDERKLFNDFLGSFDSSGTKISDILDQQSNEYVINMIDNGTATEDVSVFDFAVSALKRKNRESFCL